MMKKPSKEQIWMGVLAVILLVIIFFPLPREKQKEVTVETIPEKVQDDLETQLEAVLEKNRRGWKNKGFCNL